jgi:methylated-DNA-[protein]-cysteine S-methyltransferase
VKRKTQSKSLWISMFPSPLGWFAILGEKNRIKQLTFGHDSAFSARQALNPSLANQATFLRRKHPLADRIQAYLKGRRDSFSDVQLDFGRVNKFTCSILKSCRKIPIGSTVSYGQLARQVGFPKAARAVGNCMAKNKIPIIIPCHRVVRANGNLGSYSACGGKAMKKRLLAIES